MKIGTEDYSRILLNVLPSEREFAASLDLINGSLVYYGCESDDQATCPRIRKHIRELRLQGVPILSDTRGYWLSHDREEIEEFSDRLAHRATAILEVAQALEGATV